MEHCSSWQDKSLSDWQVIPAIYGIRRLISVFTIVHHLTLPCASGIQSTILNPVSLRSTLVVGLQSGLLLSSVRLQYSINFHLPHSCYFSISFISLRLTALITFGGETRLVKLWNYRSFSKDSIIIQTGDQFYSLLSILNIFSYPFLSADWMVSQSFPLNITYAFLVTSTPVTFWAQVSFCCSMDVLYFLTIWTCIIL
jgi:hypothetical protein